MSSGVERQRWRCATAKYQIGLVRRDGYKLSQADVVVVVVVVVRGGVAVREIPPNKARDRPSEHSIPPK